MSIKPSKLPKMKPYRPRQKKKNFNLIKQDLKDLEHKMSVDVGTLLVLLEEGSAEMVEGASQKAKSDLLKIGPDMKHLAVKMGGVFPHHVDQFLDSIDNILHTGINWIDEAKIQRCFKATRSLEKALGRGFKDTR